MKIVLSLCFVILLAACAPAPALTPVPLPVGESPTPAATWTPVPPTATATATPMPKLTMEDLKSMSSADKLKMAPQAETAPEDVVSSFAAGESAKDIAWNGKSLTFWDRVVAYEGTTRSGEKVTLYYDLESGQWAKQYADFDEVSKIPADEVADVMVVNDENGAHLVRNKLQYDYDWISQPQVMIEGKMVFRDEKGYPKAIWDTNAKKWLRPEETDIPWKREKWEKAFDVPYITPMGVESNYKTLFNLNKRVFLTKDNIAEIERLPDGIWIMVFNPSGEIDYWMSKEEAINRLNEGAFAVVGKGDVLIDKNDYLGVMDQFAWEVAFNEYQKGNKSIFVVYGDIGVSRDKIEGWFSPGTELYEINEIPQVVDKSTGRVVSPVIRAPKHVIAFLKDDNTIEIGIGLSDSQFSDTDYWLDEFFQAGANGLYFESLREN
ncbi:MAG TPA: hypothetical protein PKV01_09365 [Anaerolineales bacterium]|nr:hypothetical protein [Anaerolineales bacterium]